MTITLAQLKKLGACHDQVRLFKELFGKSVEVTESVLLEHVSKFDLDWIAGKIFSAPALAEYQKVRDAALAEYEKVCDPAFAEYQKVRAPALAEYEKVCAPAWAEYQKVLDLAFLAAVQLMEKSC
jgi:hypothetical protein